MDDWRKNNNYYKSTHGSCQICGSEDKIGVDPRFGNRVCEEHSLLAPSTILQKRATEKKQNDRMQEFKSWYSKEIRTAPDRVACESIGYKIEYLSLNSEKTRMMVAKINWGFLSSAAISETLDKIIKQASESK